MLFSSLLFLFLYLPVTLGVYFLVPAKWRNLWLFVVNLVFYGWGEPVYVLLMVFSITLNYAAGLLLARRREKGKTILTVCIVLNLALLFFFKYYDFLAENLRAIPFLRFLKPLGLSLPIGISFYTFQAMSYPIDVYRGQVEPQKSYIRFGTFVALFPQLIAGPIVRYRDIAAELNQRSVTLASFASGVRRFLQGLGKKVLLANAVGALWDVYRAADPAALSVADAWLGAVAFTLQIYFDFSGYSDMAIGLGRMLGFAFPENFRYPYLANSITDFWRRWHITLSSWFRDYVYIPLGGNRRGLGRQLLNLLIVWCLTGIWHGASWNYLLWGLYYALLLMLEKAFLLRRLERGPRWIAHVYALFLVVVGWVLFSLEDLGQCVRYLSAMFGGGGGLISATFLYYLRSYGPSLVILLLCATPLPRRLFDRLPEKVRGCVLPVLLLGVLVLSTAYLVDGSYNPFLYFRF